jgi:hypothetical protein
MLNSFQISKKIKANYSTVSRAIKRLNFIPMQTLGKNNFYDEFQIELLIEHLTNKGLINYEKLMSVAEIAKATNFHPDRISRIIQREKLKPIKTNPLRFNENQQNIIFTFLYYENRLMYLTFESKLNDSNFDTSELYSRENFISCGYIIKK